MTSSRKHPPAFWITVALVAVPGPVGDAIFWYAKLGLRCDNIEIPADMAGVDKYDSSSHVLARFLDRRRMAQ